MESTFSVTRKFYNGAAFLDGMSDRNTISSISNRNVIAFSSSTTLNDQNPAYVLHNVYVADLNLAYNPQKVLTHTDEITCLEWDVTGSKLLIGDANGKIQIYAVDNIVTDWHLLSTHEAFTGETVLAAVWFHNGIKLGISMDKKDQSLPYTEKFTMLKFGASVSQFGGKAADGCLAISSSGLVWSLIFLSDGTVVTGTEILGQFRSMIKAVDICYAKNGHFLVITSNGLVESSINCYTVNVKISSSNSNQEKNKCNIQCQPFSSFYLNSSAGAGDGGTANAITHLRFVLKEAAEAVIVATTNPNGSTIELWELREKPITIHKMFAAKNGATGDANSQPITVIWQHAHSSAYNSTVASIATPRLSMFDVTPSPSFIAVAYRDNTIKCLLREGLQQQASLAVYQHLGKIDFQKTPFTPQKAQTGHRASFITNMQFTWSGCALVAFDTFSQMFAYRLAPIVEPASTTFSPTFAQAMLEYALILGNDWWDILLSIRSSNQIDGIVERMRDAFNRQPAAVQQKYFTRFHQLQASLHRCQNSGNAAISGQCKAGDCYASIMLNVVATTLKSFLRGRDNSDKEGPAEYLSSLLSSQMLSKGNEQQYCNIDKVIVGLESKLFFVEPGILQTLQTLNQWVADFTLYLLSSIPQRCHNNLRFPGCNLILDIKSINTLRELLVIIRIWGLVNEHTLPVFTKLAENVDVIALLFRLLTKAAMCIGAEPYDETFIDECCLLPNQVITPQVDLTMKAIGIVGPALFNNSLPLSFVHFNEPSFLKYSIKIPAIDGAQQVPLGWKRRQDCVRFISLGALPPDSPNVRSCTRCHALSYIQSPFRTHVTRAWDQKWVRNCLCGGNWITSLQKL